MIELYPPKLQNEDQKDVVDKPRKVRLHKKPVLLKEVPIYPDKDNG